MNEINLQENIEKIRYLNGEVSMFRTYLKFYMGGILTTFILGTTLTMIFLFLYLFYEVNLYDYILSQIPLDIRRRYKSRIVVLVKWIDKAVTESFLNEEPE